jgi:hypothetical protein
MLSSSESILFSKRSLAMDLTPKMSDSTMAKFHLMENSSLEPSMIAQRALIVLISNTTGPWMAITNCQPYFIAMMVKIRPV